MKKYKKILLVTLVSIVAFPTITFGSIFVSSLIQGKSVPEAIQILAEQIELLINRVVKIENKQSEQEQATLQLQKQNACLMKENLLQKAKDSSGIIDAELVTIDQIVSAVERQIIQLKNHVCQPEKGENKCDEEKKVIEQQLVLWQSRLKELNLIEGQFLEVKNQCNE